MTNLSHRLHRPRQHARDMHRIPPRTIVNLMPARRAISNDDVAISSLAHTEAGATTHLSPATHQWYRRHNRTHRPCRNNSTQLLDLQIGDEFQHSLHRREGFERLLMTMAVHQARCGMDFSEREAPGLVLAREKFPRMSPSCDSALASRDFTNAGISSRKLRMQLGSSPMTGTPLSMKGLRAASVRSASSRA